MKTMLRFTRWTKKDYEMHPWLACGYVNYSSHEYVIKVTKGQQYEERKKCGAPCYWIVERGEYVYYRCKDHKHTDLGS